MKFKKDDKVRIVGRSRGGSAVIGEAGAYIYLSCVTKIEEFKAGDRVSISNIRCNVLQRHYVSGDVVELLRKSSDASWYGRFESDNENRWVGGSDCDLTPVPPIPEQIEMRRIVTTVTMTQDVPLEDFQPEYTTIEDMQEFVSEVFIDADVVEDVDVVVTKVSVELVDDET